MDVMDVSSTGIPVVRVRSLPSLKDLRCVREEMYQMITLGGDAELELVGPWKSLEPVEKKQGCKRVALPAIIMVTSSGVNTTSLVCGMFMVILFGDMFHFH